jgi:hypothetical protein
MVEISCGRKIMTEEWCETNLAPVMDGSLHEILWLFTILLVQETSRRQSSGSSGVRSVWVVPVLATSVNHLYFR